jgi:hypothetical protein
MIFAFLNPAFLYHDTELRANSAETVSQYYCGTYYCGTRAVAS